MRHILTIYAELFRAIAVGVRAPKVRTLLGATTMIAVAGALVYQWLEGWSFIDAFYFSVVSMATVGYGDLAPVTTAGRLFTIGFLVVGIGIFVLAVSALAQAVLEEFRRVQRERQDP